MHHHFAVFFGRGLHHHFADFFRQGFTPPAYDAVTPSGFRYFRSFAATKLFSFSRAWKSVQARQTIFTENKTHNIKSDFIGDQPADLRAIDFSPDGKVYALASMDVGIGIDQHRDHNFYLAMFDENLNKEWEVLYHNNDYAGAGLSVYASPKGGCLVAIDCFDRNNPSSGRQWRLLRITESTMWGIGEAEATNVTKAWPNPTTGIVRIEGKKATEIQVFNALGQLVKTVQNTNEVSLEGQLRGLYLLRVTLEDGKVFSDKVVKE